MPLWIPKLDDGGAGWAALPLAGSAYRFTDTVPFVRRAEAPAGLGQNAMLVRVIQERAENWLLVVPRGARLWVNGQKPPLGVHALAERDEIRFGNGRRLYFSAERLPQVVPFPGAAQEIICARCRTPIAKGTPSVCCPGCGTWCHQSEELACWGYPGTTHCPLCDHPNDPEAGYRWTPDDV